MLWQRLEDRSAKNFWRLKKTARRFLMPCIPCFPASRDAGGIRRVMLKRVAGDFTRGKQTGVAFFLCSRVFHSAVLCLLSVQLVVLEYVVLNGSLSAVDDVAANSGLLLGLRLLHFPDPDDSRRDLGDILRVKARAASGEIRNKLLLWTLFAQHQLVIFLLCSLKGRLIACSVRATSCACLHHSFSSPLHFSTGGAHPRASLERLDPRRRPR